MHIPLLVAGLSGLVTLPIAGAAFAGTTFLPGLYETRVSYPEQSSDVETTQDCLTQAEAAQASLERRLAEALQEADCTYTQRSIAADAFTIVGSCSSGGVASQIEQSGTYSPTSLVMRLRTTVAAIPGASPVSVTLLMNSRRVSASCPANRIDD
jgi:hypothetical protein